MKFATIFVVLLCAGTWAEEDNVTMPSSKSQFLPERLDSGLGWLSAYGRFPKITGKLDISILKEKTGEWFPDECRRYIKPALIPSNQYIAKNVVLLTAEEFVTTIEPFILKEYPQYPHFKEDILFLRYRASGRDYLIVESGGSTGRFMLFVRGAQISASDPVNISDIVSKELPMRGVAWISLEGGGCLVINKGLTAFSKPAREPEPDEWFKGLKQSAVPEATIKKE